MRTLWVVLAALAASASMGIVAAAEGPAPAEAPAAQQAPPPGWFVFEAPQDDFAPRAVDCSRFIEAPTGTHGFLKVKGDGFAFEDGTPARFWGAQFGGGRGGSLEGAVRRLRKLGINIVRQHGLENLNDRRADTVLAYSPQGFDRMDALISELGKQGVYIILDTDYYLRVKPGDVPGLPEGGQTQFLMFFNDDVARLKLQRMTDIYTHVNPYTGKRWCDDPTVALVEVCNEDSIFWHGIDNLQEPFKKQLEDKFKVWLRAKYGDEAALRKAWTYNGESALKEGEGLGADQRLAIEPMWHFETGPMVEFASLQKRDLDQLRFFMELEDAYYAAAYKHLREIGVKVPICGTNWRGGGFSTRVHMASEAKLDYIDRHGYWDHPQANGEAWTTWNIATCQFTDLPMVKALIAGQDPAQENNVGNLVLSKAWEQVLGEPMTISEWNTCLPNEYSLEGTGLMAAYGMLQGWDAPLQFALGGGGFGRTLGRSSFDMNGNPPQLLQYPAVMTMWHRHDVAEAPLVAETVYTPEGLFEWADDHRPLPLAAACVGKVGYRFVDKARPPVVKDISAYWDEKDLTAKSITGELVWNAKEGLVTIDTAGTAGAIGFLSAQRIALKSIDLKTTAPFGALYVTSLEDGKPIAEAGHLLVTAVGQARNTGMEYEHSGNTSEQFKTPMWHLKDVGQAPILLHAIEGDLTIRNANSGKLKAWALDINGKRRMEVPLKAQDGAVTLPIDAGQAAVYYEIAAD